MLAVERRRALLGEADALGLELCAAGTHPWSPWREQEIINTPHYRLVEGTLRYVAWRNNTFGMHLHVGVNGADRAITLCNALRQILPDLLALSCSSPWYEGRRHAACTRRGRSCSRACSRAAASPTRSTAGTSYARFVRFLLDTGSIREQTQIWWCVRPHQAFGTVELRNADGMPDVRESVAVAAFGYAMCGALPAADRRGRAGRDLPGRFLEENHVAGDPLRALRAS